MTEIEKENSRLRKRIEYLEKLNDKQSLKIKSLRIRLHEANLWNPDYGSFSMDSVNPISVFHSVLNINMHELILCKDKDGVPRNTEIIKQSSFRIKQVCIQLKEFFNFWNKTTKYRAP